MPASFLASALVPGPRATRAEHAGGARSEHEPRHWGRALLAALKEMSHKWQDHADMLNQRNTAINMVRHA